MNTKGIQTLQPNVERALNTLYEPGIAIYSLFPSTRLEFYL